MIWHMGILSWRIHRFYQEELLLTKDCIIKYSKLLVSFDKRAGQTKTGIFENQEFISELHKSITRNFQRHKVYSCHQDNIAGANLANMQLLSRYNKGARVKVVSSAIDQLNHGCMTMALKCIQHAMKEKYQDSKNKIL